MKKRMFGKLNMVLSTRVALVLALMLALTGCSSAKATPGNPASSSASVGTTSETITPQSTPSSNASTTDAGNDTTPVETSSDATELAEANQDTPSSIVVGTPSTVNPDDFWVSDDEYDLIGYFTACGAEVSTVKYSTDTCNINGTFENDWEIQVTSAGDKYSGTIIVYTTNTNRDRIFAAYGYNTLSNNTLLVKIFGVDYLIDRDIILEIFDITPLVETKFNGGSSSLQEIF